MGSNRRYQQFVSHLEVGLTKLFLRVGIGAAGAPTKEKGLGIESITRTGAGAYDIVLDDKFPDVLGFSHMIQNAADVDGDVQVNSVDLANRTISITTKVGGAVADLPAATTLYMEMSMKNSSVTR